MPEPTDTILLPPMTRERVEHLLVGLAGMERRDASCCENCRLTIETEEALRAALDNPPPKRTEEFRVACPLGVGERFFLASRHRDLAAVALPELRTLAALRWLGSEAASVAELRNARGCCNSSADSHLRALRGAGLIERRPGIARNYFRITASGAALLSGTLEEFLATTTPWEDIDDEH